ncbi:MAG: signal peptidase II [Actinobacteria bacterium]|nr:signal peptidase II [Actinomycetota bacterium]
MKNRYFFTAAFLIILVDQLSKFYITDFLEKGESFYLIKGIFHLTHVQNDGAAFGIFPGKKILFLILTFFTITITLFYYQKLKSDNFLMSLAFSFIFGGAVGNLIDRLIIGKVIDFLDFQVWPVFNLADSFIFIGAGIIILTFLRDGR